MSEWFETVVDLEVRVAETTPLADRVLAELVETCFVRPEMTECALGASGVQSSRQRVSIVQGESPS
jgi:hypothetical protein